MTGTVHHDSAIVDLMKTVLNFAVAFEKKYSEKLAETLILKILKYLTDFYFLTGMSTHFYYQSLNGDDAWSKSMGVYHSDDSGLYTAMTERLPFLLRAASNFAKILKNPAPFHAFTV